MARAVKKKTSKKKATKKKATKKTTSKKKTSKKKTSKKKTSKKKTSKKKTSKKKATKKTTRNSSVVPIDSELTLLGTPEALTAEILELDGRGKRGLVRNVVEIGRRMIGLQQHLGFGQWLSWLSEHLPYSPSTAQRYIAVARFAEAFPEDFEAFAHLGLLKLIVVAQLPPSRRAQLRNAGPLRIPGVTERKRLEVMTLPEVTAALLPAQGGGLATVPASIPIDTVVRRFRHRLAGLDAMADVLRARADEIDPDIVHNLRSQLAELTVELEALSS